MSFPTLRKQLNLLPLSFSHHYKYTMKLKITMSLRSQTQESFGLCVWGGGVRGWGRHMLVVPTLDLRMHTFHLFDRSFNICHNKVFFQTIVYISIAYDICCTLKKRVFLSIENSSKKTCFSFNWKFTVVNASGNIFVFLLRKVQVVSLKNTYFTNFKSFYHREVFIVTLSKTHCHWIYTFAP